MKKYALLLTAILALVVLASGCIDDTTTNQTSQPTIPTKEYSGNGVSFSYPENWEKLQAISQNALVSFGDPSSVDSATNNVNTLVVIQSVAMTSGTTLKANYDATYAQYEATEPSFQQISDSTTTVDGTTAYVNIHMVDVDGVQKQEKAVWLEKNGKIYVILCGSLPSAFEGQQKNFDAIINTFKVL